MSIPRCKLSLTPERATNLCSTFWLFPIAFEPGGPCCLRSKRKQLLSSRGIPDPFRFSQAVGQDLMRIVAITLTVILCLEVLPTETALPDVDPLYSFLWCPLPLPLGLIVRKGGKFPSASMASNTGALPLCALRPSKLVSLVAG